ncbi:MAG: MFS transporter, partial [Pyrinomonadaceae bacterium]
MDNNSEKVLPYAWYALALLTLVYVLNFLDRVLILYLFTPIKAEFNFTDLQLSLLGTTSFAIFYTLLGIPFGRMADKGSRKRLIAIGLIIWSLFSGLTGFAVDFWTLFFCRLMVGVGEATLGSAAISLLSDYFPTRLRATATSIYSMGIALGAGLAAFLGGWIGQVYGWRWAFYLLGFPGVFLAVLVFFLREQPRGHTETSEVKYSSSDWKILLTSKPLLFLYLGYALLGLATNNLNIWGATFLIRLHKFDLATIGIWGGILTLLAGIPATLLGGVFADWFRRRQRGGRMLYGAILSLFSIPFWLLLIFTENVYLMVLANFFLLFAGLAWLGAAAADVTEVSGANLRGLGIAIYFFAVNIAAYVIGSNLIGKLNDYFNVTENPRM